MFNLSLNTMRVGLSSLLLLFLFTFSPQKPDSLPLFYPAAGKILWNNPICTAFPGIGSSNFFLGPPRPGAFIYNPWWNLTFAFGPPAIVGQQVLGNSLGYSPCYMLTPLGPVFAGAGNIMYMNGTSLPSLSI